MGNFQAEKRKLVGIAMRVHFGDRVKISVIVKICIVLILVGINRLTILFSQRKMKRLLD